GARVRRSARVRRRRPPLGVRGGRRPRRRGPAGPGHLRPGPAPRLPGRPDGALHAAALYRRGRGDPQDRDAEDPQERPAGAADRPGHLAGAQQAALGMTAAATDFVPTHEWPGYEDLLDRARARSGKSESVTVEIGTVGGL